MTYLVGRRAIILRTNELFEIVNFPENSTLQYHLMLDVVSAGTDKSSSLVEHLALPLAGKQMSMWVNEEGLLRGLHYNPMATFLASKAWGSEVIIVGDALITGGEDEEGDTLPLDIDDVKMFMETFALT